MKIGIIIHSETGNTYSVALRLQTKLMESGHHVNLDRLVPLNAEQIDTHKIRFEETA
jgi:flavodoxin